MSTPEEQALAALREVILAAETYRRDMSMRLGHAVSDMTALGHLITLGDLGVSELGDRLHLSPGATTALVDRLEAAGYAERRPHARDRRRGLVVVTDAGRQFVVSQRKLWARILHGIDATMLDQVTVALNLVAANLRDAVHAPRAD